MQTCKDLNSLIAETSKENHKRQIEEFDTYINDEKVDERVDEKLMWTNMVAAIRLLKPKLRLAEKLVDEALKMDNSNIHALRNALVLAKKRHKTELEKEFTERLHAAESSTINVLQATIHYGYYLTWIGPSKIVPAFDESFQTFESVIRNPDFKSLSEDNQLQCHLLYAKALIRARTLTNTGRCLLDINELLERALVQCQKLGDTENKFYKVQKWIWLAEIVENFRNNFKTDQAEQLFVSIVGEPRPTILMCADRAFELRDEDDAWMLARIGKLYAHMLRDVRNDRASKEIIYSKSEKCNERSLGIKWNIIAASNASLVLHNRWLDSYVADKEQEISERLQELAKWSPNRNRTRYDFLRSRAVKDNLNEARRVLLETSRKQLEDIVAFRREETSFHIALARVMFALGEEFQEIADLLAQVVDQSTSWKVVCDAYQLWGYCCMITGEKQSAEDKFMKVLNLAADKNYKPRVAFEEMECILMKKLNSCSADDRDSLRIKLARVYRCNGRQSLNKAKQILRGVSSSAERCRELLLCSLQSNHGFEAFDYAEELIRFKDTFGTREFVKVCFRIASNEESMNHCWIVFDRVVQLCLEHISVEAPTKGIVVFHCDDSDDSDDIDGAINKWITRLKDVSSVDIHSAHEYSYIGKPIIDWLEQLLTSTTRAIVFLTDEYLASDEGKWLELVAKAPNYAAKLVVFYCNEEQLVTLPKSICKIQLQKHEMGTALCTRQLAYALAKDAFGSHIVTVDGLIREITNLTLK